MQRAPKRPRETEPDSERESALEHAHRPSEPRARVDDEAEQRVAVHAPAVLEHAELARDHEGEEQAGRDEGLGRESGERRPHVRREHEDDRTEEPPELEPGGEAHKRAGPQRSALPRLEPRKHPHERNENLRRVAVLVGAVGQAERDRREPDHELRPWIAPREQATRDDPEKRRHADLDEQRKDARNVSQPEEQELERPDLHVRIREHVRPIGREELLRRVDEEREIAGVPGLDEQRDSRRQGEDASAEYRASSSHRHEFGLPQGFLERCRVWRDAARSQRGPGTQTACRQTLRAQPCKGLAEWPEVKTKVEELPENRVRLEVEVPSEHMKHAVEHASTDLAATAKIPGFRKGKVPQRVLEARVGRDRIFTEAVESHIGGWFWNAAEDASIRPVSQPKLDYDVPTSEDEPFSFTAEVSVQPPPEVADWKGLEVPAPEPEVPQELVEGELEALRASVAELVPVEGRPSKDGDVLVVDLVDETGEAQRDYVVQLGAGRLVEEIERGLRGMSTGETKKITYTAPDGSQKDAEATLKEIKEPVLPPLDDELARSASEFETLEELRIEIESRLRDAIQAELEADFRAGAVDKLIEASKVDVSDSLVESRAAELLNAMLRSLESRGLDAETYLRVTGQTADQLRDTLRGEARRAISRELVLEAVADKLEVEVSDEELKGLVREQAEAAEEDPDAVIEQLWQSGRHERLRADFRMKKALDRIVEDVKPIPVELARARESIWTPEKEKPETAAKLWTPGSSKEPV